MSVVKGDCKKVTEVIILLNIIKHSYSNSIIFQNQLKLCQVIYLFLDSLTMTR